MLKDIEFMERQVDEMTKHVARIDKTKKPELDVRALPLDLQSRISARVLTIGTDHA